VKKKEGVGSTVLLSLHYLHQWLGWICEAGGMNSHSHSHSHHKNTKHKKKKNSKEKERKRRNKKQQE